MEQITPSQAYRAIQAPGALTPAALLVLQRTIGNAAVNRLLSQRAAGYIAPPSPEGRAFGRPPQAESPEASAEAQPQAESPEARVEAQREAVDGAVVQRKLPSGATYTNLDPTDARLVAIGTAVDAYNQAAKPRQPQEYQARFGLLQAVDRAIYAWFDQVSQANQQLDQHAHTAAVRELQDAAEREHEKLIDGSKKMKKVLPFDTTGMSKPEQKRMRTLWQDILNNRGKIEVLGSSKYKKRAHAELAKILSTPTGRKMLEFLNTPKGGEVAGSLQAALTKIYIGEKKKDLPKAVRDASPLLEDRGVSEAQPLNVTDTAPNRLEDVTEVQEADIDPLNAPDAGQFPAAGPGNLSQVRDAAWGGLGGFTAGGKKYSFSGKSTGAFVTSFAGQSVQPGKGTGNQIAVPGWVTLGHELGHAANMRAGSSTLKTSGALTDTLSGLTNAGDTWDNTEELLNIENVENALRGEAGLTQREGHRPPAWLIAHATALKKQLRKPLYDLTNSDGAWMRVPEWVALTTKIGKLPAQELMDQGLVQSLQGEVNAFTAKWTAKKFAAWKRKHQAA